jgi:hypothetical protein
MKQLTFVEMYMNIYNKYGKDSEELKRYKEFFHKYHTYEKVVYRVYLNIMKEG